MSATGHPAEIVLLDYLEGSLEDKESDGVRRHVASCRACRRALADLSSAFDELDRLPTAQIPHDAIWGPRRERLADWRRIAARFTPLLLAAAALVAGIVLWRPSSTTPRRQTPAARRLMLSMPAGIDSKDGRVLKERLAASADAALTPDIHHGGYIMVVPPGDYRIALKILQDEQHHPGDEPQSVLIMLEPFS